MPRFCVVFWYFYAMNLQLRLEIFSQLHNNLKKCPESELRSIAFLAQQNNPWFNEENFFAAIDGILYLISEESLKMFSNTYAEIETHNKKIGLILAGNIPAVGFHDVFICLLAGCSINVKLSAEDKVLIPFLISEIKKINPLLADRCVFVEKLNLDEVDAVLATGSDNTARYFEQYFSRKPNIIRKSRTSVAVIKGNETLEDLTLLVEDIVRYFGLGCRNVSKLLVLADADIIPLLQVMEKRTGLTNFSKYDNNYLYYKSIYLVNREPFLDTENMMFKESELLSSPISVVYYQRFQTENDIKQYILENQEKIQCVVGKEEYISFGQAQNPTILEYADGVDVVAFLKSLD